MNFKKLSIIIPVYNEGNTIEVLLNRVISTRVSLEKEIICIDDGSTDNSREIIKKVQLTHPEVKYYHKENGGKGSAIIVGIQKVKGDIILIQDGDLEYNPDEYGDLIRPIIEGKAEVVYGSRRLKEDNKQYTHISFYLGGMILTILTNLLFPSSHITDEATCYKVFRSDILRSTELKCERFEFCPEVTAKILRRGIKIYEVPISYNPRSSKQGKKIVWKDGIEAAWTLIKYRFV